MAHSAIWKQRLLRGGLGVALLGAGLLMLVGSVKVNAAGGLVPNAPTEYFSANSGNWGTSTTWLGGVVPNHSVDALVVVNSNHTVTVDSNFQAYSLTVAGRLVLPLGNILTVAQPVSNTGVIEMVRNVNNATVAFEIPSGGIFPAYRLVNLTTPNDLGNVMVSVWGLEGNEDCTNTTARRCFEIRPTNNGLSATVRLWVLNSELHGIAEDALHVYLNLSDGTWSALTADRATGNDAATYTWVAGTTASFSYFLAGGVDVPTTITLTTFSALSPDTDWPWLALSAGLFATVLGFSLWRQRPRRQAQ